MSRRKKSSGGGGSNWMDTYGDMVTLLLCFFVMLYSMSSLDTAKWEILVKSLNPNAEEITQIVTGTQKSEQQDDVPGGVEKPEEVSDFDELYYQLSKYVEENQLSSDVEITRGDGFTFVTFRNNIFFDGDSYVLKDEGKRVLDDFSEAIQKASDSIAEMQVLGHTSQARPDEMNELVSDRFLSSNRASVVVIYLQQKNIIEPAKLVSMGYGQFRPISPFDTQETRSKNRRVEILITKDDGVEKTLDDYYKEAYGESYQVSQ